MVYVKVAFCLFYNMYGVCEGCIFVYSAISMVYVKVAFCLFDNMYGACGRWHFVYLTIGMVYAKGGILFILQYVWCM